MAKVTCNLRVDADVFLMLSCACLHQAWMNIAGKTGGLHLVRHIPIRAHGVGRYDINIEHPTWATEAIGFVVSYYLAAAA